MKLKNNRYEHLKFDGVNMMHIYDCHAHVELQLTDEVVSSKACVVFCCVSLT